MGLVVIAPHYSNNLIEKYALKDKNVDCVFYLWMG
jgi:hypothetical protein